MKNLPTGTVTFLFSDIEGSTALLQEQRDTYSDAMMECRRLVRAAIQGRGGQEVGTQGDGVFAAFPSARDALLAAVAAQRAILRHPWRDGAAVKVRMGLHTGEARVAEDDYVGLDVHRAARICAAGHGGQILLSDAVSVLAARDLPAGVTLRDLGTHRLKDLNEPERLLQVVHTDLQADFPRLKTLDAHPTNLQRQLTSFVGREQEIEEVKRLLATTPLLTLHGPGGCGKTRLAFEVAANLLDQYPDGVWATELAALSDPGLVPKAVATSLDVPEQAGRRLTETLKDSLQRKSPLLVLDNCEHLVTACAELANDLLKVCPHVRILATSREPLGIPGEIVWAVPSLSAPGPTGPQSAEDVGQFDAVRLFVDRAATIKPGFTLTAGNAPAVAHVCRQLEGIPLALELAAARVKVLTVEQIAARLDDRFRLLTGGGRTTLPRHQTLRATMDWSYGLLPELEREVLQRLSVFAGGWTLEAAETVCAGAGLQSTAILDLLTSLADKSLVIVEMVGTDARYRLLETVRQYGAEKLADTGDAPAVWRRHRDWYLALAEQAASQLRGPEQRVWVDRLEVERDNLRAALHWSSSEQSGAEAGLRLAVALHWFWFMRKHLREGRQWLSRFLARSLTASGAAPATALFGIGILARRQGDYKAAEIALADSLARFRELGDLFGIGISLHHLAHIADDGADSGKAVALFEESLEVFRQAADRWGIAASLNCLGETLEHLGDYGRATPLLRESREICREIGDRWLSAYPTRILGIVAAHLRDYEMATALLNESLALERDLGDKFGTAQSLSTLASVASDQENYERAATLLQESLVLRRDAGSKPGIAECLERLGTVAGGKGQRERAARLLGAAEALREAIGVPVPTADRADYDLAVTNIRSGPGGERLEAAWAEGRAMTLEQAVEYALASEGN